MQKSRVGLDSFLAARQDMDADSQLKRVPAVKPIKRLEEAVMILVYPLVMTVTVCC